MTTRKSFYVMTFAMLVVLAPRVAAQVPTEVPPAVPGAKPVTVEHVKVHGASLEGNFKAELIYGREVRGGFIAHSFRHTFISRLAERGLPRETIMKLSGHTSTQGIEPYLHATPESIRRAAELITAGDGFLTGDGGNGVPQATGVTQRSTPKPLKRQRLSPIQRDSSDRALIL